MHNAAGGAREVVLNVGGLEFASEAYRADLPLTCTWALYDLIPLLHARCDVGSNKVQLSLLDDLEKLKSPVSIGFLESIELAVPSPGGDESGNHPVMQLFGYYVHGDGMVPSYWWVDSGNNVVISATTFQTNVLVHIEVTGGSV